MKVPFVDLKEQQEEIKVEINRAIQNVIDSTQYIKGNFVSEFEKNFASKLNIPYCIGVGNGTDAIYIALKMLGVGFNDEVITTANTFIATAEAITMTGAKPVFVDCELSTFNIDPNKIENKISDRTKAIIPVHLYGLPANMGAIMKIARNHGLYVIEDSSQAHLAEVFVEGAGWKKAGTVGDFGTFSFYPGKNLGAFGDAGVIITNNESLAIKARMFADHGRLSKYNHDFEGINSRMDGIQGAILNIKLNYLEKWTAARRTIAAKYNDAFKSIPQLSIPNYPEMHHVYHLYVVRTEKRNELQKYLTQNEISTGIHYPIALPNLPAYAHLGYSREDFPVASMLESQVLSLPMFPELKEIQLDYVIEKIREFYNKKS
ncbi:MAG: DegT/DnrJ/EryC1/StrS family aminotransferase [Bacteroidales bacterium]|nr:DegT/DnrJ/EryC1/StrS family aminotransferase [Bacteroidales bacterium]